MQVECPDRAAVVAMVRHLEVECGHPKGLPLLLGHLILLVGIHRR